jgi:hypothetical protein
MTIPIVLGDLSNFSWTAVFPGAFAGTGTGTGAAAAMGSLSLGFEGWEAQMLEFRGGSGYAALHYEPVNGVRISSYNGNRSDKSGGTSVSPRTMPRLLCFFRDGTRSSFLTLNETLFH